MVKESLKSKKRFGKRLAILANILFILGLGVFGGYYFTKYQNLKKNPPSQESIAQAEQEKIMAAVGKLYALPDEKPSIVFVKDKSLLSEEQKKQELFQKAETNDYLLIFVQSKLAILYRPSENRIVDARPVSIGPTATIRVIGETSARANAEKILKEKFASDASISGSADAKGSYAGITVVDLTGQQADLVKKIADGIGGKVGGLPEGEEKPTDATILVIAGTPL